MPFKSDAQRRFMYAAALGKLKKKKGAISEEDAKKFISDSPNKDSTDLPEHVSK